MSESELDSTGTLRTDVTERHVLRVADILVHLVCRVGGLVSSREQTIAFLVAGDEAETETENDDDLLGEKRWD